MRRRLLTLLGLSVLVGALAVVLVGPASSAQRRADVTVSDLGEPPDFAAAGTRFRVPFAVANMGTFRAGKLTVQRFIATRFFLDANPDNRAGRVRVGQSKSSGIAVNSETSRRARLRVPPGLADGSYFLVACADVTNKVKESKERNNCRISGQSLALSANLNVGPPGPRGTGNTANIERFTLPIGRATIPGFYHSSDAPAGRGRELGFEGDDEKSNQRREFAKIGPVSLVADCKRTTNGEGINDNTFSSQSAPPDDPPNQPNFFDENGDEAKILIYTDDGTVTFNSLGESSRRNIGPGEGASEESDPKAGGATQAEEGDGGEGTHMALATQRDPQQDAPEEDWAYAYRVGTIYINHSSGLQLIFTGYAGIDVLGVGDNCVFGGVLKAG